MLIARIQHQKIAGCPHVHKLITAQRQRIERVIFEYLKLVAVVAVQAVFGAKPQETIFILANGWHKTLRQSLLDGNGFHEWGLGLQQSATTNLEKEEKCAFHSPCLHGKNIINWVTFLTLSKMKRAAPLTRAALFALVFQQSIYPGFN